jgi:hypothetical protein
VNKEIIDCLAWIEVNLEAAPERFEERQKELEAKIMPIMQ